MPADREGILERAGAVRRSLYDVVRGTLDELEQAAPWRRLYYPPDSPTAFLAMEVDLLEVVDAIPGRIQKTLGPLLAASEGSVRQTLEDAEFFFSGIHGMVSRELERLRARLEERLMDPSAAIPLTERSFVCELTADLKGKYASALMGATASLVAEGLWSGVEVEPILFPEKEEEFRRNQGLFEALGEALEAIRRLPEELDVETLYRCWQEGEKVDQYALTDLSTFRGRLGRLLREGNRRALYSGDYHQIRHREVRLSERVHQLETLHQGTWSENADGTRPDRDLGDLCRLTLEVFAILDVAVLERLIGGRALRAIRDVVTVERETLDETFPGLAPPGGDDRHRQRLPAEHRSLVPLLYDDDLVTFLELLRGNVAKRASLREAGIAPAPEVEAPTGEVIAEVEVEELLPSIAPAPVPTAARTQSTTPEPETAESLEERRETLEELRDSLSRLQSPRHPGRRPLAMLQRLLEKHSRVPPSMLQSCEPYFHELLNELVPRLERAVLLGVIPADARQRLVELCLSLSSSRVTPEEMERDVPLALERIQRLLEALTSATAAALR